MVAGRKPKPRTFKGKLGIEAGRDPGEISAKVFRCGQVDEEGLEDLFANIYSRVEYKLAEKCRLAALKRIKREVAA